MLDTLVELAARSCEADIGTIASPTEGGVFQTRATFGFSTELKDELGHTRFKPGRESVIGRALFERAVVHILDAQTDPEYKLSKAQKVGGYRTMVGVPLLRQGAPIGVFGLARYLVRPFTDKQIALVTSFADQAVIAIEGTRLFDEVRARTPSLRVGRGAARAWRGVAGGQLHAGLQIVLDTIVAKAAQISGTEGGAIYVFDEHRREFQLSATFGMSDELIARPFATCMLRFPQPSVWRPNGTNPAR